MIYNICILFLVNDVNVLILFLRNWLAIVPTDHKEKRRTVGRYYNLLVSDLHASEMTYVQEIKVQITFYTYKLFL